MKRLMRDVKIFGTTATNIETLDVVDKDVDDYFNTRMKTVRMDTDVIILKSLPRFLLHPTKITSNI